jgi:hypothetical protein
MYELYGPYIKCGHIIIPIGTMGKLYSVDGNIIIHTGTLDKTYWIYTQVVNCPITNSPKGIYVKMLISSWGIGLH